MKDWSNGLEKQSFCDIFLLNLGKLTLYGRMKDTITSSKGFYYHFALSQYIDNTVEQSLRMVRPARRNPLDPFQHPAKK